MAGVGSHSYPISRIMPAGPYEGQVPMREYEEHRAHEGRMLLIEITVTGHSPDTGQIVADFGAWGKKAAPPQHHLFPRYEVDVDVLEWVGSQSEI